MHISPGVLGLFLLAAQLSIGPAAALTADDLPNFTYEDALSCRAYKVAALEHDPAAENEQDAIELDFWARLIAAKGTPEQAAIYESQFAEALADAQSVYTDESLTADDVDELLTGMAKFCWFQALMVPGVGPFAEE